MVKLAAQVKEELLNETGQISILNSILRSIPAYVWGIRCYAAFCDALGVDVHFSAEERRAIQFSCVFRSAATYEQYLKMLRFAHKLLHLDNSWYTDTVKQVQKGMAKSIQEFRPKPALLSRDARRMIQIGTGDNDADLAAIVAVSRLFLLRVPSEAIPLQWSGAHSRVELTATQAKITLMRRKNCATPSTLTRDFCCASSGRALCAVHWLHQLWSTKSSSNVFAMTTSRLRKAIKNVAMRAAVPDWQNLGTHAFRRGMAQDILDHGGHLSVLLQAGGWSSSAYLHYLRDSQVHDVVVGQAVINLSDSEPECV